MRNLMIVIALVSVAAIGCGDDSGGSGPQDAGSSQQADLQVAPQADTDEDMAGGGNEIDQPSEDVESEFSDPPDQDTAPEGDTSKCECTDSALKCCDGCNILEKGTQCSSLSRAQRRCSADRNESTCGGTVRVLGFYRVCDGKSAECPSNEQYRLHSKEECGAGERCSRSSGLCEGASEQCDP